MNANFPSKFRNDLSVKANFCSKFRNEVSVKVNFRSKIRVNLNNRHCENSANFLRTFAVDKIRHFSSKSPEIREFRRITFSLLFHDTVSGL